MAVHSCSHAEAVSTLGYIGIAGLFKMFGYVAYRPHHVTCYLHLLGAGLF